MQREEIEELIMSLQSSRVLPMLQHFHKTLATLNYFWAAKNQDF